MQNCRKRVWRSEVEASFANVDRAAKRLKQRQQTRDRCRCPPSWRPEDGEEKVGLNRIFIDRAGDMVEHPPSLAQQLPKSQRPDHVYGLRQTRNLENLLLTELSDGEYVEDKMADQPHAGSGQPMLFPFLVVEAKAGNAADDWYSICIQTAFPIYTYLNTQQSLRLATNDRSRWLSGPLVWFFANRGEDWRLYLAYQSPLSQGAASGSTGHTTNITQAWGGCITNRDHALQLFLIVDYLADWARDVYRAAILTELRIMAAPDAEISTTFTDTDIFSTRDMSMSLSMGPDWNPADDANAAFRSLDSTYGAVRFVGPIESRFLSIFITADNVQTFILSINRNMRSFFIRKVLELLHSSTPKPAVLNLEQVNGVEEKWTGYRRLGSILHYKNSKFFTTHLVTYRLSPSWSQIRELCMIFVAEDAIDTLIMGSKLRVGHGKAKMPSYDMNENEQLAVQFIEDVAIIKDAPYSDNLLACIERCAVYAKTWPQRLAMEPWDERQAWARGDPLLWEMVCSTFKFHTKGDLEPDQPFLRSSRSLDSQSTSPDSQHGHVPTFSNLYASSDGAVLVSGGRLPATERGSPARLCVYLTHSTHDNPPEPPVLAQIMKTAFEDCDVYHTTRDNGTLNFKTLKKYREIWNLQDTYGVFFSYGESSFIKWLQHMEMPLPTRQGSPRTPNGNGKGIFEREYVPWGDPRLIHWSGRRRKFCQRLIEAEALAWTTISYQRSREGLRCCTFCAGELDDSDEEVESLHDASVDGLSNPESPDLCFDCEWNLGQIEMSRYPSWLMKTLHRVLDKARLRRARESVNDTAPLPLPSIDYAIRTPISPQRSLDYYHRRAALHSMFANGEPHSSSDSEMSTLDLGDGTDVSNRREPLIDQQSSVSTTSLVDPERPTDLHREVSTQSPTQRSSRKRTRANSN
ncbi:hypothetical protein BDV19DRAFT_171837 [Aspergillus venezuelensis]